MSIAVFARLLDATAFGLYALALSAMTTGSLVTCHWLVQGLLRYLPGASTSRNKVELRATVLLLGIGLSILTAAGGAIAVGALTWSGHRSAAVLAAPIVSFIVLSCVFLPLIGVLQAEQRAKRSSVYKILESVLRAGCGALLFLSWKSPAALLWGASVAVIMLMPFLWSDVVVRAFPLVRLTRLDIARTASRIASYGLPLTGWFLAAALLDAGDRFVIMLYRGPAEVGLYAANYSLVAGAIGVLSAPLLMTLHPRIMKSYDEGNLTEANRLSSSGMAMVFRASALGAIVVLLWSRQISQILFGETLAAGHRIIPVIFVGMVLWQAGAYAHKPLEMLGRTRLLLLACGGAAVLNLTLNFVFVPRFGYLGAAYATTLAYAAYFVFVRLLSTGTWGVQ